jgi:hypothetical protein
MLGGLVAVLAVPTVQAQMQVTLYQDLSNYSYSNGGEFNAVPNAALLSVNPTLAGYSPAASDLTAGSPNFQTFCIETSEEFSPGSTYDVAISQDIKYNNGQFPGGAPITMGTALLYSEFAAGALGGYDYTPGVGRSATAGELQSAIWYLQGEVLTLVNNGADGTVFYTAAQTALGATLNDPSNGAYDVAVLNLTSSGGAVNNQDQLMVVPGSVMVVPEPGAMSFGLLFLLPLGVNKVRALFRKQAA